jgi:hypothetical protein
MPNVVPLAPNKDDDAGSQQALDFIKTVFGVTTEQPVFVCSLDNERNGSPPESRLTRDEPSIKNFVETKDRPGRGLFYCVGTLAEGSKSRSKETVAETVGLHVDVDLKDVDDTKGDVERKLKTLAHPPSIIVSSGHGFHCYWLFKEAINSQGERDRIEAALKQLADLVAGDMQVAHIVALMRLPGTHNTKRGEWLSVEIIEQNDRRYELDNLEEWLSETSPVILRKDRPAQFPETDPWSAVNSLGFKPPIDVEKRLKAMSYMGGGDAAIHTTQLSVSASMLIAGNTIDHVVEVILAATKAAAVGYGERWNWRREENAIRKMCADWIKKHPRTSAWAHDADAIHGVDASADGIDLADFIAFLPTRQYFHRPTAAMWHPDSVNGKIAKIWMPAGTVPGQAEGKKIMPTTWLERFRCAMQMTWAPGEPPEIRGKTITEGGWTKHPGAMCLNMFRPATVVSGSAAGADRWLDLVRKVYPNDADHLIRWFAHRVQHPGIKINHCLFLGGSPGIGKDTMLAPVVSAVGPWNCSEIAPKTLLAPFNGYIKSVLVRVSEARDLGDINRYEFYEASKTLCAAPPDVLRCNEKHMREFHLPNICGLILTSNYRTDGIYLPADDRRHYVCWSDVVMTDFAGDYWKSLWAYYRGGGFEDVAAYLMTLDLGDFDPTAPPLKTDAFWAIVDAGAAPEDSEFADVLDMIGRPDAVTLTRIKTSAPNGLRDWLEDRKNRRTVPHRFEKCGYVPERNTSASDGYFVVQGTRQTVYVQTELTPQARWDAAVRLSRVTAGSAQ